MSRAKEIHSTSIIKKGTYLLNQNLTTYHLPLLPLINLLHRTYLFRRRKRIESFTSLRLPYLTVNHHDLVNYGQSCKWNTISNIVCNRTISFQPPLFLYCLIQSKMTPGSSFMVGRRPTYSSVFQKFPVHPKLTDPMFQQRLPPQQPSYNQAYMPNGAVAGHTGIPPGATPLLPNNGRIIQTGGVRVLCVADVRGELDPKI